MDNRELTVFGTFIFSLFQEPKKLVRYRDSKIVSLKGERYTEVKKDDQDDIKSSGGQKSVRQHRFH